MVSVKENSFKKRKVLPVFDKLTKIKKENECSLWKGEKGEYVFKAVPKKNERSPFKQIYLNRKYFTGLWPTRKGNSYKGDIRELDKKRYLLFVITGDDELTIFETGEKIL